MSKIDFAKQRDFGEILGATFDFLRPNIIPMAKSFIVIAGIPLVIGGILFGVGYNSILELTLDPDPANPFGDFPVAIIPSYFVILIGFLLFYSSVHAYIKLYQAEEETSLSNVFAIVKQSLGRYIFASIIYTLLVMLGSMLCVLPGIYVAVALSFIYPIMTIEDLGVMDSIKRSFDIIKDNWWACFGLILIAGMIQSLISYVFMIPIYLVPLGFFMSGSGDASMITTFFAVVFPILMVISSITYTILITAIALKYYSLVETKEGSGDLSKIESFGE